MYFSRPVKQCVPGFFVIRFCKPIVLVADTAHSEGFAMLNRCHDKNVHQKLVPHRRCFVMKQTARSCCFSRITAGTVVKGVYLKCHRVPIEKPMICHLLSCGSCVFACVVFAADAGSLAPTVTEHLKPTAGAFVCFCIFFWSFFQLISSRCLGFFDTLVFCMATEGRRCIFDSDRPTAIIQ